jgi:hypothetical protein
MGASDSKNRAIRSQNSRTPILIEGIGTTSMGKINVHMTLSHIVGQVLLPLEKMLQQSKFTHSCTATI